MRIYAERSTLNSRDDIAVSMDMSEDTEKLAVTVARKRPSDGSIEVLSSIVVDCGRDAVNPHKLSEYARELACADKGTANGKTN